MEADPSKVADFLIASVAAAYKLSARSTGLFREATEGLRGRYGWSSQATMQQPLETTTMARQKRPTVLLDLKEVSQRLSLSLHTVRRWASMRRLPVVKLSNRVFVSEDDLEKMIAANRIEPRDWARL
jgi:hypothetical protein